MSGTQVSSDTATQTSAPTGVAMKFEVTALPVSDIDRAKAFYEKLGWRLDIDFEPAPGIRGIQFTPPGSPASIQFGTASTKLPGPLQGMILVVDDIETARNELIGRGVEVGEIFHLVPGQGPAPGIDPERGSYFSRANFSDSEGNTWQLQEITQRLPGRV